MAKHDVRKLDLEDMVITYVDESVNNRFDSDKFKRDHPETYELYQKSSTTKAHVRFKLK